MGGVFSIVMTGDMIRLDVPNRNIELVLDANEISRRIKNWLPTKSKHLRGYPLLYEREILQADEGCDFGFLRPRGGQTIELVEPIVGRS
jgi:dihydroxyacid dehydratase/phosphogluconate dehydratase